MDITKLKKSFFTLVPSHPPNNWEIEEHLENIVDLPTQLQELVLAQVPSIWSVSHSLCYSYISSVKGALACLPDDTLTHWVGNILDIYEKSGLRAAQQFMGDVETNFLCRIRGEAGLNFTDAALRLTPYAGSIIERRISLTPGPAIYTDTESIFLPPKLTKCTTDTDNFLLYKLITTFQIVIIMQSTYEFCLPADHELIIKLIKTYKPNAVPEHITLENYFSIFPDPHLAEDLFTLSEGLRATRFLAAAFPGLWRDTEKIRSQLAGSRTLQDQSSMQSGVVERLTRQVITRKEKTVLNGKQQYPEKQVFDEFNKQAGSVADSAFKTAAIYAMLNPFKEDYVRVPPVYYVGRLNPAEARKGIHRRRNTAKEEFIKILGTVLLQAHKKTEKPIEEKNLSQNSSAELSGDEGTGMLVFSTKKHNNAGQEAMDRGRFLTLGGPQIELQESLRRLTAQIVADLGHIPADYISAAQGIAGHVAPPSWTAGSPTGESLTAPLTYDEWDFRRNGFRKDWCTLNEKRLGPIKGTFVETTLDKYQGVLKQLKRQFEMLRSTERFLKRQRDGDDLDLDAITESISDTRAGKPPSERLFVRLQRDERDIAVLFLVDMSSSTEGWVSQSLKEALILMGEALQVLGDRFAIYGFSGMRRTRSDFYRIKNFDEPYNKETKGRIAAIGPQEYTRMGPPLRHAVELLQNIESRVRLLVTLSDGKPEDYDDYKGEYAIEDTRHALIEAKAKGIHPFCITIDKQAHDYIGHMYGEVNYIFVDEVRKLPIRLPEIYRVLTT
jgi:nitric oxide reductase NorD protein